MAERGRADRTVNNPSSTETITIMHPHEKARGLCLRAQKALHEDELNDASHLVEEALRKAPDYVPALLLKAQIHLMDGEADDAFYAVEEAEAMATAEWRADDIVMSHITGLRGYAMLAVGRFQEAILILREARQHAERAKERGAASNHLGYAAGFGTPESAIAEITWRLSDALALVGRTDEAITALNSTIIFVEGPPDPYVRLARIYEGRGDFQTAATNWMAAGGPCTSI